MGSTGSIQEREVKEGVKKIYTLTESARIHSVLPAHTEQEESITTESLLNDGCIEPLVVWEGVLIDGYLRYHICHENGIPFEVVEMDFADETEAILWVIQTHIGRRNLSIFQKCEIMMPFREALAAKARQRMVAGKKLNGEASRGETDQLLADMAGVSRETIRQVRYIIEHGDQETLRRVRKGEISVHRAFRSLKDSDCEPSDAYVTLPGSTKAKPDLQHIRRVVSNLISCIAEGEATPKAIIAELKRVNFMIEEAAT